MITEIMNQFQAQHMMAVCQYEQTISCGGITDEGKQVKGTQLWKQLQELMLLEKTSVSQLVSEYHWVRLISLWIVCKVSAAAYLSMDSVVKIWSVRW